MSSTKVPNPKKTAGKSAEFDATPTPPKDLFGLQWKSLGIGFGAGMLLFLLLLMNGLRPTEVDLLNFKFSVPSFETDASNGDDPLLGIGLVNMKFMAGEWDPRQVDMAKAASEGLYVRNGDSLLFYDLWISVPEKSLGYMGQITILAADKIIGQSEMLPLTSGGTLFKTIKVISYQHPTIVNAWSRQSEWEELIIELSVFKQEKRVGTVMSHIRLNGSGTGWYLDSPYAHIVSLVYQINDDPKTMLDLQNASEAGIAIAPGDQLTIGEIWVKTAEDIEDHSMRMEAYLSAEGYDPSTLAYTSWEVFEKGIHDITTTSQLKWGTIPSDRNKLIITLTRNDKTVLDRYEIPLRTP